jgi:hypothetical protein
MANTIGWGQAAVNNTIDWGKGKTNNTIGWGTIYSSSPYGDTDLIGTPAGDADANAFIAAAAITDATQKSAIDKLVTDLKGYGIWTKMKALYPFVTDNRNLLGYTENFDNATWTKTNISVTANNTTSPDGTTNADKLSATIATVVTPAEIIQSTSQLGSTTYSYSVYAKKSTSNFIALRHTGVLGNPYAWFNLNTGTIGTVQSGITASIQSVGNGWYRCTIVGTTPALVAVNRVDMIVSDNDANYVCAINGSIFIWGAQLELGSTVTSYQRIPTTQQAYIASQFKFNLVNPIDSDAAFRLVFNGGWVHSSTGAKPNGVNGFANTFFKGGNWTSKDNAHMSYYSRTDFNGSVMIDMGVDDSPSNSNIRSRDGNMTYMAFNGGMYVQAASTNSLGLYIANRVALNTLSGWKNNTKFSEISSTSISGNTAFYTLSAYNNALLNPANYSVRECAFSSFGDGLTDTQAANYYTAIQAFQTTLSRNV